jgi:hypothetical protein
MVPKPIASFVSLNSFASHVMLSHVFGMCNRKILNKDFFYIKHQSLILGHDIVGFILTCKMQFLNFLTKRNK